MITAGGPKVIEYNCRFGDPETEVLMPLLESDLLDILLACTQGRLHEVKPRWSAQHCCTVVVASPGYPQNAQLAEPSGLEAVTEGVVFRAGSSGRLLAVSGIGSTLSDARDHAYAGLRHISVAGGLYRTDIAAFDRALRT